MRPYYLGADIGGTKTHALVCDSQGRVLGFGESGPGNHEIVGYAGLTQALSVAVGQAFKKAGISIGQITGAGFGVAGYDWPSERQDTLAAIRAIGLTSPVDAVNDALIGLLAGSEEGWGVAVVSGTGCNCRGWDRTRQHLGMAIGAGLVVGEGAGASELIAKAVAAVAHDWTRSGPITALSQAFVKHTGARDLADLIEGIVMERLHITAADAPLVFQVAADGDPVAIDLIRWAGYKLGEMANGVIRQMAFEELDFEVVLVGSMYDGSPLLAETLGASIHTLAPFACLKRLTLAPVIGAALLGMEAAGVTPDKSVRMTLAQTLRAIR